MGSLIGGRYRLAKLIGEGGQGAVWRGLDELTAKEIAIKMFAGDNIEPARVRREVLALRLLRLPGVVELRDEGSERGKPYIVTSLIEGTPFPGIATPAAWPAIADRTFRLLETLQEIHAAGIVHRDLKPGNVLIDSRGEPVVLDFGVSFGEPLGHRLTATGMVVGTPAYLAPEQMFGLAADFQSDLFSVGVMLFEALSGKLPQDESPNVYPFAAPSTTLGSVAPTVPQEVANVVDALVGPADRRPATVDDVLTRLRPREHAERYRFVGDGVPLDKAVRGALRGCSTLVVGASGMGRSRWLREVARRLIERGVDVRHTSAGTAPFSSMRPVIGTLEVPPDSRLAEVQQRADRQLRRACANGLGVIVADDIETIDPWSMRLLERAGAGFGLIASALTRSLQTDQLVELSPIATAELAELTVGPSRLFHVPEDAAALLADATDGVPQHVVRELDRWVAAGDVQRRDGRITISPKAIVRLRADRGPKLMTAPASLSLGQDLSDILQWARLLSPHATIEHVAKSSGRPQWEIEAAFDELISRGAMSLNESAVVWVTATPPKFRWNVARQAAARRDIVGILPIGSPGRLLHALVGFAGDVDADAGQLIAIEAVATARRLVGEGRVEMACLALAEAWSAVWPAFRKAMDEAPILETWVEIALMQGEPSALDRVMFELSRATTYPTASALMKLVAGALATLNAPGPDAYRLVRDVPNLATRGLELRRHNLKVVASTRCSSDVQRTVLRQAVRAVKSNAGLEERARVAAWLARWRYRQGRFAEAAALHERAANLGTLQTTTIDEQLRGAAALMETWRNDDAVARASAARDNAAKLRDPVREGWAEWVVRAARYRRADPLAMDDALVDVVRETGVPELRALVCFTEAAIGLRLSAHARVFELACEANELWQSMGKTWTSLIARALSAACASSTTASDPAEMFRLACECPVPGLGIQVLGLLATRRVVSSDWIDAGNALASKIPAELHGARMDVLSVDECMLALSRGELRLM